MTAASVQPNPGEERDETLEQPASLGPSTPEEEQQPKRTKRPWLLALVGVLLVSCCGLFFFTIVLPSAQRPGLETSATWAPSIETAAVQTGTALARLQVTTTTSVASPTATATAPQLETPTLVSTPGPLFADVPLDHPDRIAIETVYLAGALPASSVDPTMFGIDETLTRTSMAMAICVVRYQGEELPRALPFFDDVNPDERPELASCIQRLYEEGIIAGCQAPPNALFCPDKRLTLAEYAVFFERGVHEGGWQPPEYNGWPWGYYPDGFEWAIRWGEALIREGYWDWNLGRFIASDYATKGIAARAIYLFLNPEEQQ